MSMCHVVYKSADNWKVVHSTEEFKTAIESGEWHAAPPEWNQKKEAEPQAKDEDQAEESQAADESELPEEAESVDESTETEESKPKKSKKAKG